MLGAVDDDPGDDAVVNVDACTGTLIAPTLIITADHCRNPTWGSWLGKAPDRDWVDFEADRRDPTRCADPDLCDAPEIFFGPRAEVDTVPGGGLPFEAVAYSHPEGEGDMLILRLNQAVPPSVATPIRPLTASHPMGAQGEAWWRTQTLRAVGWGLVEADGGLATVRQTQQIRVAEWTCPWLGCPTGPLDLDRCWNFVAAQGPLDGDGIHRSGDSGGPFLWRDALGVEWVAGVFAQEFGYGSKLFFEGFGPYCPEDPESPPGGLIDGNYSDWVETILADEETRLLAAGTGADGLAAGNRYVDADLDGAHDPIDNCPGLYNPSQTPSPDGGGNGLACDWCLGVADNTDTDGDRVGDACDNCPAHPNASQDNCNAHAEWALGRPVVGDACDPHACAETTPRTTRTWSSSAGVTTYTVEPAEFVIANVREPSRVMDRTGFRFCRCSAAERRFDDADVQRLCLDLQLDGTGSCDVDSGTNVYDIVEPPGALRNWREVTMDYASLEARIASYSGGASIVGGGTRSEIADYKYIEPDEAHLLWLRSDRGLLEVRWDAAADVARWSDTSNALDGVFWSHAYVTTGDGTGGGGATDRRLQSHYVDGPFYSQQTVPFVLDAIPAPCFAVWPVPGAPGPVDGPTLPRLPLAAPRIDCLSEVLAQTPPVFLTPDRIEMPWPDHWWPRPQPTWVDFLDRFTAVTAWEQSRLHGQGLGLTATPYLAAIELAPDLSTVRGGFQMRLGSLEPVALPAMATPPPPRSGFHVAMQASPATLWAAGGHDGTSERIDVWRLDVDGGTWSPVDLGLVTTPARVLGLARSAPTRELLVLYQAPIEGVDHAVLIALRDGADTPSPLGVWPLTASDRGYALAVGDRGDVFVGSADDQAWRVARLQRDDGTEGVVDVGTRTGAGTLVPSFFVADALGVSTVVQAPQQGAMDVVGLELGSFVSGSAADVF